MMKTYPAILMALVICSCSSSPKKGNIQSNSINQQIEDSLKTMIGQNSNSLAIVLQKTDGKAVLIGDKIELLDQTLKPLEDISTHSREIIEIKGVSDSLFNQSNEICNAFWYVKIKVADKEGVVNGRQVYKIGKSRQDTSIFINSSRFEILTTEFFGMGVSYEGDLMGCPVDQPIIIRDERNGFFGLVDVIQNDLHKKAIWNHNFPFFELRSDDGNYDRIDSIIINDMDIRLKIHRFFMEGENDYEVLLRYDQNKYTAEYLSFGEIKYE